MGLIRQRRSSTKTLLGITGAKRSVARRTGIPTTRSGRRRKAYNAMTGGRYGKYQRSRAAVNRPFKRSRRASSGCLVAIIEAMSMLALFIALVIIII